MKDVSQEGKSIAIRCDTKEEAELLAPAIFAFLSPAQPMQSGGKLTSSGIPKGKPMRARDWYER